jgi:hypothetical protein
MNPNSGFEQDLASIRQLMERSVKFLSLSGLSGILAGVYALVGAAVAYVRIPPDQPFRYSVGTISDPTASSELILIAILVLVASLITGLWLSSRRAKRLGVDVWDQTGRRLAINLAIPLLTGGVFIILLYLSDHFALLAPSCLIFYGLALVNASPNLVDEIRFLGLSEIVLGLLGAAVPGIALFLWAFGFGVLHIIYGSVLYRKYEAA